jgi:prophage regulatory protein
VANMKSERRLRRLLRKPDVLGFYGKSESELHADVAAGRFPAPVPIGTRAVAWFEDEIIDWQEARKRERLNPSIKRSLPLEEARQSGTLRRGKARQSS